MSAPRTSTEPDRYPLGRSEAEAERLMLQHRIYASATARLVTDAGISSGMRVLDLGSGVGDVSLLLADIVGPSGQVVGVDMARQSIMVAARRADAAGVGERVRFVEADLRQLDEAALGEPFDAVVGRWVLMYQPDPAELVRRLATLVTPDGIIVFQESDLTERLRPFPRAPLHEQIYEWLTPPEVFTDGPEPRMGPKLHATFLAAGLPAPALRIDTPVGAGPGWGGYELLCASMRSLLPAMTALGIVTPEQVDIDTLAARLEAEVAAHDGVQPLTSVYGAWTRIA